MAIGDKHGKGFVTFDRGTLSRRIGLAYSEGSDDAFQVIMTSHTGKLDPSLLPDIEQTYEEMVAETGLQAGDFVHIKMGSTGATVGMDRVAVKASAVSAGTPGGAATDTSASGFVTSDVALGAIARVYTEGVNTLAVPSSGTLQTHVGQLAFLDRRAPGRTIAEHEVSTLYGGIPVGTEFWLVQSLGRIIDHAVTSMSISFKPGYAVRIYGGS